MIYINWIIYFVYPFCYSHHSPMVLSEINSINKKVEKIDIKKMIFSSFVDLQDNLTVSEETIKGKISNQIWEITKIKN